MDSSITFSPLFYIVITIIGTMMGIIGYLIIRLLNQLDSADKNHDKRLDKHDEKLDIISSDFKTLEATNKTELKSINDKLERMLDKLDQYDESWRELFEKYEMKEKN